MFYYSWFVLLLSVRYKQLSESAWTLYQSRFVCLLSVCFKRLSHLSLLACSIILGLCVCYLFCVSDCLIWAAWMFYQSRFKQVSDLNLLGCSINLVLCFCYLFGVSDCLIWAACLFYQSRFVWLLSVRCKRLSDLSFLDVLSFSVCVFATRSV